MCATQPDRPGTGYRLSGDGSPDATVPIESHLAHWDGGTLPERWSCPGVLDGTYRFRFDRQEETLTEEESEAVSRFVGMKAGGRFYLEVIDSDGDAAGAVRNWSVVTSCQGR